MQLFILHSIIVSIARAMDRTYLKDLGINQKDFCPEAPFCPNMTHIVCGHHSWKPISTPGPKCFLPFPDVILGPAAQNGIIKRLNLIRSQAVKGRARIGNYKRLPRAYGLEELTWDSHLATFAQLVANDCIFKLHNCFNTYRFKRPKQFMTRITNTEKWLQPNETSRMRAKGNKVQKIIHKTIHKVISKWYDGRRFIRIDDVHPHASNNAHKFYRRSAAYIYLHILNKQLTHVGCGISTQLTRRNNQTHFAYEVLFVCNFSVDIQPNVTLYETVRPNNTDEYGCIPEQPPNILGLCKSKDFSTNNFTILANTAMFTLADNAGNDQHTTFESTKPTLIKEFITNHSITALDTNPELKVLVGISNVAITNIKQHLSRDENQEFSVTKIKRMTNLTFQYTTINIFNSFTPLNFSPNHEMSTKLRKITQTDESIKSDKVVTETVMTLKKPIAKSIKENVKNNPEITRTTVAFRAPDTKPVSHSTSIETGELQKQSNVSEQKQSVKSNGKSVNDRCHKTNLILLPIIKIAKNSNEIPEDSYDVISDSLNLTSTHTKLDISELQIIEVINSNDSSTNGSGQFQVGLKNIAKQSMKNATFILPMIQDGKISKAQINLPIDFIRKLNFKTRPNLPLREKKQAEKSTVTTFENVNNILDFTNNIDALYQPTTVSSKSYRNIVNIQYMNKAIRVQKDINMYNTNKHNKKKKPLPVFSNQIDEDEENEELEIGDILFDENYHIVGLSDELYKAYLELPLFLNKLHNSKIVSSKERRKFRKRRRKKYKMKSCSSASASDSRSLSHSLKLQYSFSEERP